MSHSPSSCPAIPAGNPGHRNASDSSAEGCEGVGAGAWRKSCALLLGGRAGWRLREIPYTRSTAALREDGTDLLGLDLCSCPRCGLSLGASVESCGSATMTAAEEGVELLHLD